MFVLMVADGRCGPRKSQIVGSGLGYIDGMGRAWKAFDPCAVPRFLAHVDSDDGRGQRRTEDVSGDDEKAVLCVGLESGHGEHRLRCVDVLSMRKLNIFYDLPLMRTRFVYVISWSSLAE